MSRLAVVAGQSRAVAGVVLDSQAKLDAIDKIAKDRTGADKLTTI